MLTEARAERITPDSHSLARDRLEATKSNLRSDTPIERFDPTPVRGLDALKRALENLQTQVRIGEKIALVNSRREIAERARLLEELERKPEETKVFDIFTASDLTHLLHFYHAFHSQVDTVLQSEGGAIKKEKIKSLGEKIHEASPANKTQESTSLLIEKRRSIIDKAQGWLDNPDLHLTMDRLIPESNDNHEEDVWDFMESIRLANKQLGTQNKNLKMFMNETQARAGSFVYRVDFSRKVGAAGVVQSGSATREPENEPLLGGIGQGMPRPFSSLRRIVESLEQGRLPTADQKKEEPSEQLPAEEIPISQDIEVYETKSERRRKIEEQTKEELKKIKDDLSATAGFSLDQTYTYGQVRNLTPGLRSLKIEQLTKHLVGRKRENDRTEQVSGRVLIGIVWLAQNPQVSSKAKNSISKMVDQILEEDS